MMADVINHPTLPGCLKALWKKIKPSVNVTLNAMSFILQGFAFVRVVDKKPQFKLRASGGLLRAPAPVWDFCHIMLQPHKNTRSSLKHSIDFCFFMKGLKDIFPQNNTNANVPCE